MILSRPTFIDVKPSSKALERKTFFENLQTESKRFYNEVLTKVMKINSSSGEVDYWSVAIDVVQSA